MVGEDAHLAVLVLDEREELRERIGGIEVGGLVAELPVGLRQRRPPEPALAERDVDQQQRRATLVQLQQSGVRVRRTSAIGAKAETMSEIGAVTALSTPLSVHVVRIDIESLPTGMETPSRTQVSSATARTVSYSAASSPGWPAGAIQFAESLTSPSA